MSHYRRGDVFQDIEFREAEETASAEQSSAMLAWPRLPRCFGWPRLNHSNSPFMSPKVILAPVPQKLAA